MNKVSEPIKILVVDDHPIYRSGLVQVLREEADFDIVGEGGDAAAAVDLAVRHGPNVVLLDISMPGGGISAVARILERVPAARIAMLTASEAEEDVTKALEAGATGYLVKGISGPELTAAVRNLAADKGFVSPELAMRMLKSAQNTARTPPEKTGIEDLSRREEEILTHLAQGKSNKEIAEALNIKEPTVKHYISIILQKLNVRNRVEAALKAHQVLDVPSADG